ncbi:protein translocase subunit SecD [Candidatus Gottesmanbacteria bacterium]|nr:protein translocase subunit SecD [Candidatus Gottesmanbacteria bacterium]
MKNKVFLTFVLILLITFISIIIDLPKNYRLGPISSPNLNISLGNLKIQRDFSTKFGLDLKGGSHLVLEADMDTIQNEDRESALVSATHVIERRVNLFGVSEPLVQSSVVDNSYRIIVELPGISDINSALSLIGTTAQLSFKEIIVDQNNASESAILDTSLTGASLKRSQVVFDPNTGRPQVGISFNDEGSKMFEEITARNVGKAVAIFLDNSLVSAPVVNEPITGGNAVISGDFTIDQAKELSSQLNAGALPVPVSVVGQTNIGPTLGEQSIKKSVIAGLIGLSLVVFFMLGNYGKYGIVATFALAIYTLVSIAIYKLIPITLTLPGIAGFILSIGMAVDSNILIFERIKEEKRDGRPTGLAMELGFGRAWDSIRDANITTLLTAFILFNPFDWKFLITSGSIRGFATTLALGIFVGLFTGIVVTRTLMRMFFR